MRFFTLYLFSIICCQAGSAQLLEAPVFSFERFSWGMNCAKIRTMISAELTNPSSQPGRSIFKQPDDRFLRSYADTMFQEQVAVGLQFSNSDSILQSVTVTYIGIDSVTKKAYLNVDERISRLWERYSSRLGAGCR